ncbi:MAG: cyclic nucleotide-binding domain-containing protein [Verrucomicrobiota bacterium]
MSIAEAIQTLPVVSLRAGTNLITEGEKLDRIHFLRSGTIEITREGIPISTIRTPGSVLGEVSVLMQAESTATVTTLEDSTFHLAEDPVAFLTAYPEVTLHVSKLLATRLAAATNYLVDVKEQLKGCSDHVALVDGVLDSILHRDLKKVAAVDEDRQG